MPRITNELKEIFRQIDICFSQQQETQQQETQKTEGSGPAEKSESFQTNVLVERLYVIAELFHALSHTETIEPYLLAKRSGIEAICASKSFDFATIEKTAEATMSEGTRSFYRECIKTTKP